MQFTPVSKYIPHLVTTDDTENIPPHTEIGVSSDNTMPAPTFDRAAALAAIEYRRGRARSIANGHVTPRKQMVEGVKERRDISAPALGQNGAAEVTSLTKGTASVGRAMGKRVR